MMPDHRNFASYYGNTLYPVYRLGHIRHHTHAGNYKDTPSNRVLQRRTAMDTFFPLLQIILKTVWTDDIPVRCIISIGFYLVAGPRLSGSDRRQVPVGLTYCLYGLFTAPPAILTLRKFYGR